MMCWYISSKGEVFYDRLAKALEMAGLLTRYLQAYIAGFMQYIGSQQHIFIHHYLAPRQRFCCISLLLPGAAENKRLVQSKGACLTAIATGLQKLHLFKGCCRRTLEAHESCRAASIMAGKHTFDKAKSQWKMGSF